MLIRSGALDIIVIDSVAALVPRAEIEGEMGDSHVGLQARLMSQALRKITGALSNSGTTAIFINQLREKIGVMFGCFSYGTRVTLADGTQEKIGKIVNQKLEVEVLSYDPETDQIVPRRIVNWFDNGPTEQFLQFTVAKSGGNGRAQFAATANHLIRTPGGWREAGELGAGDRVMLARPSGSATQQWQVVLGSLMGDANLSPNRRGRHGVRFRLGHGAKQATTSTGRCRCSATSSTVARTDAKGRVLRRLHAAARAGRAAGGRLPRRRQEAPDVGVPQGADAAGAGDLVHGRRLVHGRVPRGCRSAPRAGGRVEICVEAMSPGSRERVASSISRTPTICESRTDIRGAASRAVLQFDDGCDSQAPGADRALRAIRRWSTSCCRGSAGSSPWSRSSWSPSCGRYPPGSSTSTSSPRRGRCTGSTSRSRARHNYFVDGVMVHNSPETTTGGKALKFYASVRLDVRRIETLKDGTDVVGNRTRVKVVKNKIAPPFKQAEFDIMYGSGISREGVLIDVGVEQGIVRKSGAWYTYEGDQLGQGKENARAFLRDNPDLAAEIEKKIKEKLGIGRGSTRRWSRSPPVDF